MQVNSLNNNPFKLPKTYHDVQFIQPITNIFVLDLIEQYPHAGKCPCTGRLLQNHTIQNTNKKSNMRSTSTQNSTTSKLVNRDPFKISQSIQN